MAWRSLRMASMMSSRSEMIASSRSDNSLCSSSARRLTAPSRSRSTFSRSSRLSTSPMSGNGASASSPAWRIARCGGVFSASWMRASASRRRSSAALSRSSARARCSRDSDSCLDGGGGCLVQLGLPVLGHLQAVGGILAQGFGLRQLRQQRAALRIDLVWRLCQSLDFGHGLHAAGIQRSDLCRGIFGAQRPGLTVGGDCRKTPRAGFGLALQSLMDGARIGQNACARLPPLRPKLPACRAGRPDPAPSQAAFRLRQKPNSPRADRRRSGSGFAKRRAPAAQFAGRLLGAGQRVARLADGPLGVAPGLAGRRFRSHALAHHRLGGGEPRLGVPDLLCRGNRFGVEFDEPVLLRQPLRGRGRRIGAGGQPVPAPQRALLAHQPLAGLQQHLQPSAIGRIDNADLREAAGQLARRPHLPRQGCARPRAGPDRRPAGRFRPSAPALRGRARRRDPRRVPRRAPSRSRGRPRSAPAPPETGRRSRRSGSSPACGLPSRSAPARPWLPAAAGGRRSPRRGPAQPPARPVAACASAASSAAWAASASSFFSAGSARLDILAAISAALGLDGRKLPLKPVAPLGGFAAAGARSWLRAATASARSAVKLVELRLAERQRRGRRLECAARVDASRSSEDALSCSKRRLLRVEALQNVGIVADHLLLARNVGVELLHASLEFGVAGANALGLLLDLRLGDRQALERGGGGGFGIAQFGQAAARRSPVPWRRPSGPAARSPTTDVAADSADCASASCVLASAQRRCKQRRLGLADVGRQVLEARCLARLALQALDLAFELADDVVEPLEILLGGAQAQFRLVAARMQAGNAGRLFQQRAARLRLGLDQFADAALPDHRRASARRSTGRRTAAARPWRGLPCR